MSDYRSCRCTGKSSVCDQCDTSSKLCITADCFRCVEHLRHSASLRSFVTDEDCITFLYFMLKYCIQTFFLTVKWSCTKYGLKHLFRACRMLDHSSLRCKISTQYCNTSVCTDGLVIRTDDIFFCHIDIVTLVKFLKPFITFLIETVFLKFFQVLS